MVRRQLEVLLVDDDSIDDANRSAGVVASIQRWLGTLLKDQVAVTHVPSKATALEHLQDPYDLVLLDLNLGPDNRYGGAEILVGAWDRICSDGMEVILYSGHLPSQEPFAPFSKGGGPFRFVVKSEYEDQDDQKHCSNLEEPVVTALRRRALRICHIASPNSAEAVGRGADSIAVAGAEWSVDSLIAPFLVPLPDEPELDCEAVRQTLFPNDQLLRLFSFWFKASAYAWPANAMYGLSTCERYHLQEPSSAMDALTHTAISATSAYRAAALNAERDLASLVGLEGNVRHCLSKYIASAKEFDIGFNAEDAERFQGAFKCTLAQMVDALGGCPIADILAHRTTFSQGNGRVFLNETDSISNRPLYMPTEGGTPCILAAFVKLSQNVANFSSRRRILTDVECKTVPLIVRQDTGKLHSVEMPQLLVAVAHDGPRFASTADVRYAFEQSTHTLASALGGIRGCGRWFVLSGCDGNLDVQVDVVEKAEPRAEDKQRLLEVWGECQKENEHWSVLHVIRLPIPVFRLK